MAEPSEVLNDQQIELLTIMGKDMAKTIMQTAILHDNADPIVLEIIAQHSVTNAYEGLLEGGAKEPYVTLATRWLYQVIIQEFAAISSVTLPEGGHA